MILIATGMAAEARLMAGPGILVIAGGGNGERLERELDAAAATARLIVSSGLAGALAPSLKVGDLVLDGPDMLIDRLIKGPPAAKGRGPLDPVIGRLGRLLRLPHARPAPQAENIKACGATVASGNPITGSKGPWPLAAGGSLTPAGGPFLGPVIGSDHPIGTVAAKADAARGGALAVDMESHIARRVAARHGLPCLVIRVISDDAGHALPPAALAGMRPDGGIALGAVLASLARHPGQVPALVRTARDANRALRVLRGVHDVLRRSGIGSLDNGQFALDVG